MKLKSVDLLMRRHPLAPDVEKSVVGFLGPPRSLPLSEACRYGSIHLLDWIWGSTDDPNSKWFLATSLRSNVHYHQWQFTKSLEVAAARGDLDIVKWLFEHFEGCEALSSVADAAAKNGNLSVLQFLLPFKVRDGDWRFANTLCGGKNVVHWGDNVLLKAAENGQVEVAKWLLDKEENALDDLTRTITIEQALIASDFEFVDRLLPTDGRKCVLSYDLLSPGSEMIEWMLDTGYFKWDEHVAGSAIRDLAGSGHLELMQQIMQLHSPLREATENWFAYWGDALETACSSGQLKVVQWLIEHPLGRKRRLYLNATIYIDDLLCAAAGAGRVQVMRYLFEHGVGDKYGNGILRAARNGHSEAVKWLLKHFCYDEQVEMDRVVREAMTYGHAETLQVFQELESSVALEPLNDNKQKDCAAMDWWGRVGDVMNHAASRGHLAVLEWFHKNRNLSGSPTAMDKAAAQGHLEVVKWLHTVRSESCSTNAMDDAASRGFLRVVEWLDSNRSEGCTTSALDRAAEHGHLEILQYLHKHRPEGCTSNAINKAVSNGHVRVAFWLYTHYPDLYPNDINLTRQTPNIFEIMVFLREHYPSAIDDNIRSAVTKTRRIRLQPHQTHQPEELLRLLTNWFAEI